MDPVIDVRSFSRNSRRGHLIVKRMAEVQHVELVAFLHKHLKGLPMEREYWIDRRPICTASARPIQTWR
jgi:hypothetical protein